MGQNWLVITHVIQTVAVSFIQDYEGLMSNIFCTYCSSSSGFPNTWILLEWVVAELVWDVAGCQKQASASGLHDYSHIWRFALKRVPASRTYMVCMKQRCRRKLHERPLSCTLLPRSRRGKREDIAPHVTIHEDVKICSSVTSQHTDPAGAVPETQGDAARIH